MKGLALIVIVTAFLILSVDLMDVMAREFEHGITDSKVERPDRNDPGMEPEQSSHGQSKYHSMVATAYCLTGSTATGTTPRPGIAASKPAWFGKQVNVYQNDKGQPGALIGTYTVEDTGGAPIQSGSVIDIWLPTEDECFAFGRRCVLVEVID